MEKIVREDGTEVEVFTKEELDAARAEEKSTLEAQIKEKDDEIKKLSDKDLNFKNLRDQKDSLEKKLEDLSKDVPTKIEAAKNEVLQSVMKEHYTDTLKALAGNDEELLKKIELQYSRLGVGKTKEEITKNLTDAWVLASGRPATDALNTTVLSSGGVGRIQPPGGKQAFSANEIAFTKKLAEAGGIKLTDEDFKK